MRFLGQHILSTNQFERESLTQLFQVADKMQPYAQRQRKTKVLDGAILSVLFNEESTRTKLSFSSAFNLLGGSVLMVNFKDSATAKGESISDTAKIISDYSDMICMRHDINQSVQHFSNSSSVPVINGGDGTNEHPTQALLDVYTLQRELSAKGKSLDGLKIAMIGDLKMSRTIHSLCNLLCLYNNLTIELISPTDLALPDAIVAKLDDADQRVNISTSLEQSIGNVDCIYTTRVQQERYKTLAEADQYRGSLRLNQSIYQQYCQADTFIMHPLPRDSRERAKELDVDLDDNPNLVIFRQAHNGLLVRMALFALVLGVETQVADFDQAVNWFRA